jgi:ADP-ribose pyrophosphatase YjhB (NUDIX family)
MVLQGQPDEDPTWAVPGGSIEPGEMPEEAAAREWNEETGMELCALRPYTTAEGVKEYRRFRVFYFTAKARDDRPDSRDPDGLIHRVAWIPFHKLPALTLTHEDQRQILNRFTSAESA